MVMKTIIFLLPLTTFSWASTLISVVQVFRHGQRTPTSHYTNDPYSDSSNWPVSPGQLTNNGKTQHYDLGNYTRERYSDILPKAYASEFFYAQTTDVDRTHMSAQCNVLGLFPPTITERWNPDIPWSPIPIHPSATNIINLYPLCDAYSRERTRVLTSEPYYNDIDNKYADTYKYLTEYSGDNITSLSDTGTIFDDLFIENEFGFPLPAWTETVFPEPLTTLSGYLFQSLGYTTTLARLGAGTFLNEVIEHFEKMKEDPSSGQFFRMYSAHDNNIVQILSGLGAYKPHSPYYASSIYFELRKTALGIYHVNIYYKQKDVIEKITPQGCFQFDCDLSNLKKQLGDVLIDSATWTTECAA